MDKLEHINFLANFVVDGDVRNKYRVSQKKGYHLKSSASAACSNLNALSPQ